MSVISSVGIQLLAVDSANWPLSPLEQSRYYRGEALGHWSKKNSKHHLHCRSAQHLWDRPTILSLPIKAISIKLKPGFKNGRQEHSVGERLASGPFALKWRSSRRWDMEVVGRWRVTGKILPSRNTGGYWHHLRIAFDKQQLWCGSMLTPYGDGIYNSTDMVSPEQSKRKPTTDESNRDR